MVVECHVEVGTACHLELGVTQKVQCVECAGMTDFADEVEAYVEAEQVFLPVEESYLHPRHRHHLRLFPGNPLGLCVHVVVHTVGRIS